MSLLNKKAAFTLAEVLVTLGLLGSLAAITLPTLTYNYKGKVLEQQFRATYSELREVGSMINIDKGDVGDYAQKVGYIAWDKELMSHFGGSKISNTAADMPNLYKEGKSPQGPLRFRVNTGRAMICDNDGVWLDNKGRIWTFNAENNFACVDINGMSPPNRINVDIFAFKPMSAKEVAVWQYSDTVENAGNYSGAIVPCDLDRLSGGGSPNGDYANNNLCPGGGSRCCNGGTEYEFKKGSGTGVDACPYNEPLENVAPMKKNKKGDVIGNGTSSKGKTLTQSNNYWNDYINYK